jgi:glycosyltransferase involved in cell wall biosynthesis
MRVALIAPPWVPVPPPAYGGTEGIVDLLARGLQEAGQDVLLFTTGDSTCPVPRAWALERAEGDKIGMTVPELRHLLRAYHVVSDWGPDVVHDHTIAGPLISLQHPDLPVVTTNHGPFGDELDDIFHAIAGRVPIIAISERQRSLAPPGVPVDHVIHHGLDPEAFPVGKGDGGFALFLGRMTPEKGAHRAARVARAAGARLLIAAKMREPWEHRYFEERVQPVLDDNVVYVGEADGQEKLELLGSATALLNPIRWPEPFGLVMIESLACGTPVLSFAEGAAPEIIEDGRTGRLCADEDEMATALVEVDRLDRHACRQSVEDYFSTRRMVAEHLEVYAEAATRRPSAVGAPR